VPGLVNLLRCVGRAALKNSGRALAGLVPFGEAGFDIARDAYQEYRKDQTRVRAGDRPGHPDNPPVTIRGPSDSYTLRHLLAVGDAADIHLTGSASGAEARSTYVLKVSRSPEGDYLLDGERRTLADLRAAAGATTYGKYLPALAESFVMGGSWSRCVNVFLHEPGFYSLEQVHRQHPALDGRHLAWIFKRLLTVLGFCHRRSVLHGAVLPCHVLVHAANHGLQLIGWGQSVRMGRQVHALSARYRSWYPPEVLRQRPAAAATDLFLAARCLVYLAGGDPVRSRVPEAVPAPMRRFFDACLLEGPRMRPDDAWALLEEFDELLERLYGPPKFHPLTMT
jgi:hypothetical protein